MRAETREEASGTLALALALHVALALAAPPFPGRIQDSTSPRAGPSDVGAGDNVAFSSTMRW